MPTFWRETLVLLGSGLATRALGFWYRVQLSRALGAQGLGLLAMSGPVFWFALTLATSGLSVALSKLVAERAVRQPETLRTLLGVAVAVALVLSGTVASALYALAPWISHHLMTDPRSYYPLVAQIPALVLIALAVVLRGYFLGVRRVTAPAVASIVETLVRLGIISYAVDRLAPRGLGWAAAGAAVTFVLGEAAGLLVLGGFFLLGHRPAAPTSRPEAREPAGRILGQIFALAGPVTVTRLVGAASDVLDAALIPRRLELAGFTRQAATAFLGELSGMALPLLVFPTVVTSALTQNLIPAVSDAWARGDMRRVRRQAEQALSATLLFALPASLTFAVFGRPLSALIYRSEAAGALLVPLALVFPFAYLEATLTALLRGLGHAVVPTVNGLAGSALRLLLVYTLAAVPGFGVSAVLLGIAADIVLSFGLNLAALARRLALGFHLRALVQPALLTLVMLACQRALLTYLPAVLPSSALVTAVALGAGAALYAALLAALGGLRALSPFRR